MLETSENFHDNGLNGVNYIYPHIYGFATEIAEIRPLYIAVAMVHFVDYKKPGATHAPSFLVLSTTFAQI